MKAGMRIDAIRAPLMAFAAMGLFWGAWGALIPEIQSVTGASDGALGAALLCVAVGAIPSMIVGGRLVDLLGVGHLLPVAIAGFGLAAVLPALAVGPVWLGLALLVVGMTSGFMDIVMNAGIADAEARTGRSAMQLAHGTFAAVYTLTALAAGQARGAGVDAGLILATVTVTCFCLAAASRRKTLVAAQRSVPTRGWFPGPVLIALGLIGAVAFMTENGLQSWSALFLERLLAAPPEVSSLAPATVGLAVAIGRFAGQGLTVLIGDMAMLLAGALLGGLGCLVFALSGTLAPALAGIFLGAAGVSILAPTALSLAGRIAGPERRGAAVATVGVIAYSGFFVGPALIGVVSDGFGLRAAILVLAACAGPVIALALAIQPPLRSRLGGAMGR